MYVSLLAAIRKVTDVYSVFFYQSKSIFECFKVKVRLV
jgi:hypothetical protein